MLIGATIISTLTAGLGAKLLLGAGTIKAATSVADQMLDDAYQEGYKKASQEYEIKFGKQVQAFQCKIKDLERNKQEYLTLINDMEKYIRELESDIERLQQNNSNEKIVLERKKELTQQGLWELRGLA